MPDSSPAEPKFMGGSVAQHVLFVLALCRFQHHRLPLVSVHYLTWSVVHLALNALALALLGPVGPFALCVAVTAWAVRMDVGIGLLFGLMTLGYAFGSIALVPLLGLSTGATVALAIGCLVGAIVVEAGSHVVIQGYPPKPPPRATASLPARQKRAFVPYFVVTFGLFFLTLDLAMRFLRHRPALNRRANAVASEWHADAMRRAGDQESRELQLHRRAMVELS